MKQIKGNTLIMTVFFSVFIGAILFIGLAFIVGTSVIKVNLAAEAQNQPVR